MIKPFNVRVRIILEDLEISEGKVLPVRYSAFPPWKLPSVEYCSCLIGYKKDSSDGVVRQHFLNHLESHNSSVPVFTDGSNSDTGVGFGVVFPDFNYCGALPANASVFTSELYGL